MPDLAEYENPPTFRVLADTRIVLVEDDAVTSEVVAAMLSSLGVCDLVEAASGHDALEAFSDGYSGVQIAFCDLRMPGMDGLELIRHLSRKRACYGVVLVSGEDGRILASAAELARVHGVRVLGTLTKPVRREQLKRTLKSIAASLSHVPSLRPGRETFKATIEDLSRGIEAGELVVHYQPRVSARTGGVGSVEGLVRWQHPTAGLVPPGAFVPLAEQAGLIDALTWAVVEQSLTDLATWRKAGMDLAVSINATVDTLALLDFPDQLASAAARHGVPLTSLVVEVTESRLASHFEHVLETLTRLRLNRVGVAIDDFGKGYSTMDQLRRIPFTELKVDRAFVRGAGQDATIRAILESSVGLARQLGMTSVAEGVETAEDLEVVSRTRCDEVQGYFFARPMPAGDLQTWATASQTLRKRALSLAHLPGVGARRSSSTPAASAQVQSSRRLRSIESFTGDERQIQGGK